MERIDRKASAFGGIPGTSISCAAASALTSIRRAPFCDSASTNAACGKVTARSSGVIAKRSATATYSVSSLASRNSRTLEGVTKMARLRPRSRQNSRSSSSA